MANQTERCAVTKMTSRAENLLAELEASGFPEGDEAEAVLEEMVEHFDKLDEAQQSALTALATCMDDGVARKIEKKTSRDGELELSVAEDQMAVWLSLTPPTGEGRPVAYSRIIGALRDLGVRAPIDPKVIRGAQQGVAQTDQPVTGVCVCRGRQPTAGADGRVDLLFESADDADEHSSSPGDGPPNRPTMHIPMVKVGQALVRVVPPSPGKLGQTVFGQPVAPPEANEVHLVPGENVTYQEDEGLFLADIDGTPELQNDVLSVRNVYVLAGDVDVNTGSVQFPGSVTIEGSVRDGFYVRARDDIRVHGSVEAAEIVSQRGSVFVRQGINGRSRGIVTAAEDVEARFAENACLHAGKNIRLQASVRSQLLAGDSIDVCRGRGVAIAGRLTACHRIEVKVLGSSANVLTEMVLGMSPEEQAALKDLDRSIAAFKQAREKVTEALKGFESKGPPDRLGEADRELFGRLKKVALVTGYKLRQCEDQRKSRLEQVSLTSDGVVRVKDKLMPGVCIRIGNKTLKVDREQTAAEIRYNPETDNIECTA